LLLSSSYSSSDVTASSSLIGKFPTELVSTARESATEDGAGESVAIKVAEAVRVERLALLLLCDRLLVRAINDSAMG
jgi:hypothetical protein